MSKNLVRLAVIGIAAGTCVSGNFAPVKVRPDLASANANAVAQNQGDDTDAGSGYCSSAGYGEGEAGCGGRDNCANSGNSSGKGPSNSSNTQSCSGKQGCSGKMQNGKDATKQMKKSATQSKNMETKRKSAAARVVEGR